MERTTGFEPATLTSAKKGEENRPPSPSQSPDVVSCPPIRPPSPSSPPIPYTGLPSRRPRMHWHATRYRGAHCSSVVINPCQIVTDQVVRTSDLGESAAHAESMSVKTSSIVRVPSTQSTIPW
jgi:hypothetical protein